MQEPKCQCGAIVQHLDNYERTDTGVQILVGRCGKCARVVKFRAVDTPRPAYLLADVHEDRDTPKLLALWATLAAKRAASSG